MFVTAEVRKRRLELCRACPQSSEHRRLKVLVCALCGCPLASKTPFAREQCPAGKW